MTQRKNGIRALQAKAHVFMYDLECPYCGELLESPEGNGSMSFSVHEGCPSYIKCSSCEKTSRAPKRVKGCVIQGDS